MSFADIEKEIKRWDTNKTSHLSDIPTKISKQNIDFISLFILGYVNKLINGFVFSSINSKISKYHSCIEKRFAIRESNYRFISVLPNLSKIFENVLWDQNSSFFENIFLKYQNGFQKGFNPKSYLVAMIESCKTSLETWICCITYESLKCIRFFIMQFNNNKIACLRIWQSIINP